MIQIIKTSYIDTEEGTAELNVNYFRSFIRSILALKFYDSMESINYCRERLYQTNPINAVHIIFDYALQVLLKYEFASKLLS